MEKVVCIIVTYNRSNLLLRCLSAINEQKRKPDCILVVDNASTDNTNFVVKNHKSPVDIKYIKLSANIGGAGGFYTGLKIAYENGCFTHYWVMDDDGVPESNCLFELLKHVKSSDFISPLVISIENKNEPSFTTLGLETIDEIKNKYPNGIIKGHANPFNGIILSTHFLKKVGFPKKDMFIWGDENEYQARAIYHGFQPITIINAIHYHPKDRMILHKDFLGRAKIVYVDSVLRNYCKYRNTIYVLKKYKNLFSVLFYVVRYIYFFIISRRFDTNGLKLFIEAVSDGLSENFSKHTNFLNK